MNSILKRGVRRSSIILGLLVYCCFLLRKIGLKMYLLRFIWKLLLFLFKIGTLLLGYSTERSVGKVLEGLPLETVYFMH